MVPRNRIKRCIPLSVIVPKLEYAGYFWEGNAKFVKQLEAVQTAAAKKTPRRSSKTTE